jgi:predicted metal-dependent HD superfamily phosphohydrolase
MKGYNKLRKEALRILNTRLPKELHYHGAAHTLDVLKVCNQYIKRDKIPRHSAKLLRIAALLHDIGFTEVSSEHESKSAEMAEEMMTRLGFSHKDIWIVKRLILSTKIPQSPKNHLEKVICDADLDYLGRDDFKEISDKLYKELKATAPGLTKNEWNKRQIEFLKRHAYHTEFARKNRQPKKEERIRELQRLVLG